MMRYHRLLAVLLPLCVGCVVTSKQIDPTSELAKTVAEMRLALEHDILCFNVESIPELHRLK